MQHLQIIEQGQFVSIEAPDGQVLEGLLCQAIDLDNLEPFAVMELETNERIRVNNPWDCEIDYLN